MRRFSLLATIIALMAMNSGLYAQEKDTVQTEPQVKLELVWEKEFSERITNYFVDVDDRGIALLINISFSNDSAVTVRFANRTGELKKLVGLKPTCGGGVLQSRAGAYYGTYEITNGLPGDIQEVSFSLYNEEGALVWAALAVPGLPLRILDNGALLCTENPYGWSHFALWKQDQVLTRFMPSDAEMATGSFDISANSYMIFNISDVLQDEQIAQLILYDGSGKELWRKKFLWKTASTVCISDNGQFIAARGGFANTIFVFSFNGSLLWQKHVGV